MSDHFAPIGKRSVPIIPLTAATLDAWLKKQDARTRRWVAAQNYAARPDSALLLPDAQGKLAAVLAGIDGAPHIWSLAALPALLPAGSYRIDAKWRPEALAEAALGFALAQYQFGRYRKLEKKALVLELPAGIDRAAVARRVDSIALVRDLINTPAGDMGPEALAAAAQDAAKRMGGKFSQVVGEELLTKNYPAIHAVGRAATQAPRLARIEWGKANHPHVVLVGKGVTFDTGGLDLKPLSAMKLMKKDMGGAALMIGLAQLIAAEALKIRLTVLLPIVENAIDGDAFRPQDILRTRKGLTVEIGSTDAEGRLILADALAEAERLAPELIIDAATLTGAARTALGTELPALYSNRDALARGILDAGSKVRDPLWHMPLWAGYDKYVGSQVADLTNTPNYNFAGSITAALFLQRFVERTPWVHIDTYAWNAEALPGRPAGGEALALRALFGYLQKRFG